MIQKLRAFLLILLTRCLIYQRIMVKRIFFYRLNTKQIPTDCLLDYFCHILGVAHFSPSLTTILAPATASVVSTSSGMEK